MKELQLLIEELTQDTKSLISYIVNNLETASKEKLEKIKQILNTKDINENKLLSFLRSKGIEDLSDQILTAFDKFNQVDQLIELINNPFNISSKDLLSKSNVYSLFDKFIDKDVMLYLTEIITSKNTVARGRYEVLLDLLLNDITSENTGNGDVNTSGIGFIELKGPGARIKGSLKPSPGNCTVVFKELISEKGINTKEFKIDIVGIFKNSSYIKEICLRLLNDYNLSQDDICEIIAKSMLAKYIFQDTKSVEAELIDLLKNSKKELFGPGKNAKIIYELFLVLDMYFYQLSEGWNYIMIFKGKNKKSTNGDYVLISSMDINKGLKEIQKIFNKHNITTSSTIISDKDAFSSACSIIAK